MNTTLSTPLTPRQASHSRAPAIFAGFLATLISLPAAAANAIDFPSVPLQSGSTVPPNIMFILDDSGSMANDYMPAPGAASDTAPTTTTTGGKPNIGPRTAALNGVYYDPAQDYLPWRKADKSLYPDPGPTAASDNDTTLADPINLNAAIQTYYVPKANGLNLTDAVNYYRYQILVDGRVVRAELQPAAVNLPLPLLLPTAASAAVNAYSPAATSLLAVVPLGASNVTITSSGGTPTNATRGGDLYVRTGANPTTATFTLRSINNTNAESISIANPVAGTTYFIRMFGQTAFSGATVSATYTLGFAVDGNNCDVASTSGWDWTNCVVTTPDKNALVTPTQTASYRSAAAERANYATWYTFYRTRNKTAKAGASQAFSDLGENLRVGFNTIWNRSTYNIPVGSDGGLFRDTVSPASTNRTTWFNRLFAATASSSTPLQGALQTAGEYYKSTANSGPYGPESGTAQLSCRQNFAILTTDGFWNDQSNFNAGATNNSDNESVAVVPMSADVTGTPFGYTADTPFKDNWNATLADVAMKYWKTDLRTDLDNRVGTSPDDRAYWQHMTTFGISIGLQGTLNPKVDLPALTAGTKTWPSPLVAENATRIDDLWHASVNGHGEFVAATNSKEFAEGLKAALAAISRRLASGSSVATTGPRVTSSSKVFASSYFSGAWTGEVSAYQINSDNTIGTTPLWTAGSNIPLVGARKLFSFNGTAGIPFAWASLTTAQQTALGSQTIFNYLRGDRSGENTTGGLRVRDTLLGDIVNSSPEYLLESATTTPITLPAVDTVFVGANDGMLHAFNGVSGVEQFAYVPGGISFGDLKSLSVPSYAHYFFVDGPLVISKRSETLSGKNILVGALGRGGHGVYALDVSNPASFGASSVLWERTADAEMGNVLGKPIITRLNNGVDAVIVSNGINGSSNLPALFVYNLATGVLIKKLNVTGAAYGSAATPNGLSAPRGWDADSDGDVDLIYAGDVLGNVWKFDLSNANPALWSAPTTPLFSAKDAGGKAQPITGGLSIALNPTTFDTWIFFGTGRFLTGDDLSNRDIQTWYGIRDSGTAIPSTYRSVATILKQRQVIYYRAAVAASAGPPVVAAQPAIRAFGPAVAGDMVNADLSLKSGWYLDLINPPYGTTQKVGERMVFDPLLVGGTTLVESSQAPTDDPCKPGGAGYVNAVDAFSGGATLSPFFDINGDGFITAADKVTVAGVPLVIGSLDPGVGMPSTPIQVGPIILVGGSATDKPVPLPIADTRITGRISWREILRD